MTKDELIAKAEALGIDVDGRWSMKRIQEEIDEHEGGLQAGAAEPLSSDEPGEGGGVSSPDEIDPSAVAPVLVRMLPVLIHRGYWPADGGEQIHPGQKVELPADEARRVVGLGIGTRADDF